MHLLCGWKRGVDQFMLELCIDYESVHFHKSFASSSTDKSRKETEMDDWLLSSTVELNQT